MFVGPINGAASHREFILGRCQYIAQLSDDTTCDQLWFVYSRPVDHRKLVVRFASMQKREEFNSLAMRLGRRPEKLAMKLLLSFMENAQRQPDPAPEVQVDEDEAQQEEESDD